MARTDVLTTAKRIRRHVSSSHRQEDLVLLASVSSSDTTWTFTSAPPNSLQPGTLLACELELVRVVSVNTTTNAAVVLRGYLDSVAVAHAALVLAEVSPRFSLLDVYDQMQSELDSWSPALYYPTSTELSVATTAATVELPATAIGCLGIIDIRQSDSNDDVIRWPRIPARLIRGSVAEFSAAPTSGLLLRLLEPVRTGTLYVTWAMPYASASMGIADDLVTDTHLENSMLDVLEMGTARRLMHNSDYARSARQAQDEARRTVETPVSATLAPQQYDLALYIRRKTEEANRLRRLYPLRLV